MQVQIQILNDAHHNVQLIALPSQGDIINLTSYEDLDSGHEHLHYLKVDKVIHHIATYPEDNKYSDRESNSLTTLLCTRVENPLTY